MGWLLAGFQQLPEYRDLHFLKKIPQTVQHRQIDINRSSVKAFSGLE